MQYKIQYTDQTDRQAKIDANRGKILILDENIQEGNFLTFSDVKPIENQVADLQENQLIIMNAIADLYSALPDSTT